MRRKLGKLIRNRRFMAALATFLFASDIVITMMASNVSWFNANAATTGSLASMRSRAESIINYTWTPSRNIRTWNNSKYNGSTVFKAGVPVKGVPFSLFTSEVVNRSQLTLSEYKSYASKNYSATAICKSTGNQSRTGPVYGSCCAAFVSEVMGGSWMGINVTSIATNRQASHISDAYAKQVKVGDALDKGSHIIWIGDITDKYYVLYEQTPPVAHKVLLSKSSAVDAAGRFRYGTCAYTRISRFNLNDTNLSVSAPNAKATARYYAENATATVKWGKVSNASYYIIDVIKDGKKVVKEKIIFENYFEINKGNGDYEVYVTAVSGYNKKKSKCVSFTVGRLDTPEISNTTEYYESAQEVTLEWNDCTGATAYHLAVAKHDDENFINTKITTNAFTFSPEDGYYEACVEAVNENGGLQKTVSNVYSFFVGNKRLIAIDPSVKYFAHGGNVTLNWNECEGVPDYTLKITEDGNEVLHQNISGSSSFTVQNLPDGQYKAVVSAVESNGEYDWLPSKAFSFYVGKLDKPVVTADTKYHPLQSKATVSWNECTGAVCYHIAVTSRDNVIYEDELSGTTCTFDIDKGKYSVSVSSVNTNGGRQECRSDTVEVWAVSLDVDGPKQSMYPEESASLRAVLSEHDSEDTVTWTSGNSKIVSVASDGTITAKGVGCTNVSAHLGDLSKDYPISVVPDLSFDAIGASIRLTSPYGIRFGMKIDKNQGYKSLNIVEYGTLIIGTGTLGNNDLTLETKDVLKIKATKSLENTSKHLIYTGVLINIPKNFFDTEVVGRGYLQYLGLDGETYTVYTSKVVRSYKNVVQSAYNSYRSIENPNISQLTVLKKLQMLLDECNQSTEEQTDVSSANEEQPGTSSANEEQPGTSSANEEQCDTSSANEEQPGTSSANEEQPDTSPANEETSSSTVEQT